MKTTVDSKTGAEFKNGLQSHSQQLSLKQRTRELSLLYTRSSKRYKMVNNSACNLRKPVYMVQYIQTRHSVE